MKLAYCAVSPPTKRKKIMKCGICLVMLALAFLETSVTRPRINIKHKPVLISDVSWKFKHNLDNFSFKLINLPISKEGFL